MFRLITGIPGRSGFGSASTAEEVTQGIDATNLTAIITGEYQLGRGSPAVHSTTVLMHSHQITHTRMGVCARVGDPTQSIAQHRVVHCRRPCPYQLLKKVCGASGIGLETARVLALRNAHVIIAARNLEAANEAKQMILKDNVNARVDVLKLDLASFGSISDFADNFLALNLPLNILMGHFYLTNLLLDKMKATTKSTGVEGRIVNLASVAHLHTYEEGIRFEKINDESRYHDKKAYGQSKLANILHANELSRRLQEEGVSITVNSVHPGLIMTNLFKYSGLVVKILRWITCMLWKSVPQGAATTCYVALHPSLNGTTGKYFADCNEFKASRYARSKVLAQRLWDFSCKLINAAEKH
ncbi:hypothetical protein OROMI_029359 [Orobanche minor]